MKQVKKKKRSTPPGIVKYSCSRSGRVQTASQGIGRSSERKYSHIIKLDGIVENRSELRKKFEEEQETTKETLKKDFKKHAKEKVEL